MVEKGVVKVAGRPVSFENLKVGEVFYFTGCHGLAQKINDREMFVLDIGSSFGEDLCWDFMISRARGGRVWGYRTYEFNASLRFYRLPKGSIKT